MINNIRRPTSAKVAHIDDADEWKNQSVPSLIRNKQGEEGMEASEASAKMSSDKDRIKVESGQESAPPRSNNLDEICHESNTLATFVTSKKATALVSSEKKSHRFVKWLLAVVVAAAILWVCIFTALATHSDVVRQKIYPAFETKYFDDKAGARIFSYLGIFYLFLGTLTYVALIRGVRLPKPAPILVRTWQVPFTKSHVCLLEVAAVVLLVSTQIATFIARVVQRFETPYWPTERVWYEVCKTLGKMIVISLMVLLFPVSKNCFWWDLFNFQFERAIKFHRWIAWGLVWIVIAHATTAIVSLVIAGQFTNCMWPNENCHKPGGFETWKGYETSRIFMYGWISVVIALPLVITSLPWFRRNKFECFYYTHFLFIPFFIMLHLHYKDMIYYMAPGLAAYILDKVVWFCASRRCTRMVSLTMPAPGFVRVTIALDNGYTFEPGQWIQINIPAVSFWEWHPMSVASAPGHSTIRLDVKVSGDWTEKLSKLAARFDPTKPAHTCIFVDMFHGSSHREAQGYLSHPVIAMFAGGIGATPMMSALRNLVEDSTSYPHIRKAVFVWCVKKYSSLELYREELAEYQAIKFLESGCELEVIVHATLSEPEIEQDDVELDVESKSSSRLKRKKPGPFMQHVMGYHHQLILTVFAGCGCLFGIFIANLASYEKEWWVEAVSTLQLLLAVVFAALFSGSAMTCSFLRPTPTWSNDKLEGSYWNEKRRNRSGEDPRYLDVAIGCRPDPFKILELLKNYCKAKNLRSVGVSVCGPELMVSSVIKASKVNSSRSVEFVVDEETFEW